MTAKEALYKACKDFNLDTHIKEINKKSDCITYSEKIASLYNIDFCKNSYMYLDNVDFCFYNVNDEFNFSISGNIRGNDKLKIKDAISKALDLCKYAEKLIKGEIDD